MMGAVGPQVLVGARSQVHQVADPLNHWDPPSWGVPVVVLVDPRQVKGGLERRLEQLGPRGHIGHFRDDL